MKRTRKNKKSKKNKTKKVYDKGDFASGDGMLTSVWGPSLWHYLHTMSFNYPTKPTRDDKKHYKEYKLDIDIGVFHLSHLNLVISSIRKIAVVHRVIRIME